MSFLAWVDDVGRPEGFRRQGETGEDVDAVAHDQFLRQALGDVRGRAAGVLLDDLDLLAGDFVAMLGDIEVDAGLELVGGVGKRPRIGQDDADLDRVGGPGGMRPRDPRSQSQCESCCFSNHMKSSLRMLFRALSVYTA